MRSAAPSQLLVVVDKPLTGFDAPPCTYLYIDKSMQDPGLFQAICRTNRLDGEDKDFGSVVNYKDLFIKVENAIAVYTSELDHSSAGAAPEVLLQDRLKKGKERLDNAIEALVLLRDPAERPKGDLERKVGRQAMEIDFLWRCLQRVEEQRKLQALTTRSSSTRASRTKCASSEPLEPIWPFPGSQFRP